MSTESHPWFRMMPNLLKGNAVCARTGMCRAKFMSDYSDYDVRTKLQRHHDRLAVRNPMPETGAVSEGDHYVFSFCALLKGGADNHKGPGPTG